MVITPEEFILIIICVVSYLTSMYTQATDPDITLTSSDWVKGFLWSLIGGVLAYKMFSFNIQNPGEVWVYTVVISVVAPRMFIFLSNHKNQDRLINSIFNRFSKRRNNDDNDDNGAI